MDTPEENKPVHSEKAVVTFEREARKAGIATAALFILTRSAELFAEGKDDRLAKMLRGLAKEVADLATK